MEHFIALLKWAWEVAESVIVVTAFWSAIIGVVLAIRHIILWIQEGGMK